MPAPVVSVAQMREWEQATWATGQTAAAVIQRVGGIVARRAVQMVRPGARVLVLAGKGHNGDDARAAWERLPGKQARLLNVTDPAAATAEIAALSNRKPALIIDGLFGIGLDRPLDAAWVSLIQQINELGAQVLAIDVPSGLNAETGQTEGAAIKAAVTLTLAAPKQGLLLPPAWDSVGRLEVAAEIGLVPCPVTNELVWSLPSDFHGQPPARAASAHKGDFGRLTIVAGSLGYHGAAVLAARGAQRAQPGLITLQTPEVVYHAIAPQLQAVMVGTWQPATKLAGEHDAILIGPGLAAPNLPDEMKMMTRHLWRDSAVPVVVDASALDWLPIAPVTKSVIRVITPHPGEAARLLRMSVPQVQADRSGALREISRRFGNCWVALKGHQTLIGRSTGEIRVNCSGNPHLAQGGSGDVLAGFLAGLLAQPGWQKDPLAAISYAVWQHGAAADFLDITRRNWVVEDLAREIGGIEAPGSDNLDPAADSAYSHGQTQ